jgi:hypothetical protein
MASRVAATVGQVCVCALVGLMGAIMAGCKGKEYKTLAPASTTEAGLRAYCNDSGLHFDPTAARDTILPPDSSYMPPLPETQVTIVPEAGSAGLNESDIAAGRIIALITVKAGAFPEVGMRGTGSACWFVRGTFTVPDSVTSTFIPKSPGDSLHRFHTRTHQESSAHTKAEVKWKSPADTLSVRPTLPVRLAALLPAQPNKIRALAWSTCTGGYCCSPTNPHQ